MTDLITLVFLLAVVLGCLAGAAAAMLAVIHYALYLRNRYGVFSRRDSK